ncbi:MAG: hypothetical protein ACRC3Y_00075 [Romboutsia sp.]|uniref:hypothetical protein n=1 Tax=Romboutsia sp. TaxID=1965302 RepID=UPI003F3BB31C
MKKEQDKNKDIKINSGKDIKIIESDAYKLNIKDKSNNVNIDFVTDDIDEVDIDKMLESFEGEEIKLPNALDIKLDEKLKEIEPRKNRYVLKGMIACILVMVVSFTTIPSFRSFASDILKLLFSDVGVQNAVDNGYIEIEGISEKVGDFTLDIDNIFIDELRLTFDVVMTNLKVDLHGNSDGQYMLECKADDNFSVTGVYTDGEEKNSKKSNFTIINSRHGRLFEGQKESIEVEIAIIKEQYIEAEEESAVGEGMLVGKGEFKTEIIGTTKLSINIPKEIYSRAKTYDINKDIKEDDLEINIESLTVSPTMMYLDTKIDFCKVENAFGLYNFSILSDSGYSYKDNLTISGIGKEGQSEYRQTIVPSIYYDKGKEITLKAEGIIVQPKDVEIELKLDDIYPKKVEYFGTEMTIEKVVYRDGEINISIKGNKQVSHAGFSKLDGQDYIGSGANGGEKEEDRIYIFAFKGEEKESYLFSLSMMMKYEVPIEVKIPIK